jgi:hypothetical protein
MASIGVPVDDVSGVIVGGNYGMAWVTYDGRKQGGAVYPTNMDEAENMLDKIIDGMKEEYGDNFKTTFPLQKWKYHFEGL